MKMCRAWLYFSIGLLLAVAVAGWGEEGHEIAANIAYRRLSPEARAKILEILAFDHDEPHPLGVVANWADHVKYTEAYRWSAPLHYVDVRDDEIEGGCPCESPEERLVERKQRACRFEYPRDCEDDWCAAGAIANYTHRLSQSTSAQQISVVRRVQLRGSAAEEPRNSTIAQESLKFAVHFVADIHQPLHCSRYSDKGGNDIHVVFHYDSPNRPILLRDGSLFRSRHHHGWNLHAVWDTGMIERAIQEAHGGNQTLFEQQIEHFINENPMLVLNWLTCKDGRSKVCTSRWAEESFEDALQWAYENVDGSEVVNGSELSDEYYQTRLPIVIERLAASGVRLAASLEMALSGD